MPEQRIPTKEDLLWPTLVAVARLGGSASIDEIADEVIRAGGFDEATQSELHLGGPQTEIEYRLAWARTYLKGANLLLNSTRGVWSLTPEGVRITTYSEADGRAEVRDLHTRYLSTLRLRRLARSATAADAEGAGDDVAAEDEDPPRRDWKDELLEAVLAMPPDAFERLAQRLLREAGFTSAVVTGRSGDGGIDGLGVYRVSLVSFPVYYQCKRYRGSVGPGAVRDFRGAMTGRGDKGLLITTGTFTADAKAEATRDGAPPIDLIDGDRLCDLLKEYEVGVITTKRVVEDVAVDRDYFGAI